MEKHNLEEPGEIITWTYNDKKWSDIAALSVLVYEGVKQNDAVSENILKNTVENIGTLIKVRSLNIITIDDNIENGKL